MENKNKDLEDLLTKYKPSGLDESFNHKINSIFSKNSDDDLALSENKIIPFPFIQKIATVAAITARKRKAHKRVVRKVRRPLVMFVLLSAKRWVQLCLINVAGVCSAFPC